MKPNQADTEKDPAKQSQRFDQQPVKARELELLKDQAERSTGQERVETNRKIRTRAEQGKKP
jgi:hypothetical protein